MTPTPGSGFAFDYVLNVWDLGATIVSTIVAVALAALAVWVTRLSDAQNSRRLLAARITEISRRLTRASRFQEDDRDLWTTWETLQILARSERQGEEAFELVWCIVEAERMYQHPEPERMPARRFVEEGFRALLGRVLDGWVKSPRSFARVFAAERAEFLPFGEDRRTTGDKYSAIDRDEKYGIPGPSRRVLRASQPPTPFARWWIRTKRRLFRRTRA